MDLFSAGFHIGKTGFLEDNYHENVNIYQNIGEQKVNDVMIVQRWRKWTSRAGWVLVDVCFELNMFSAKGKISRKTWPETSQILITSELLTGGYPKKFKNGKIIRSWLWLILKIN